MAGRQTGSGRQSDREWQAVLPEHTLVAHSCVHTYDRTGAIPLDGLYVLAIALQHVSMLGSSLD